MRHRRFFVYFIFLTAMVAFLTYGFAYVKDIAKLNGLMDLEGTKETLRALELPTELYEEFVIWENETEGSRYEYMNAHFITGATQQNQLLQYVGRLKDYRPNEWKELNGYMEAVWSDLMYFPVPASGIDPEQGISYVNTWMNERSYGGSRGHEGTDLMASENVRGVYPVVSMTDGVVEKIGWLPKGGWRIGIRSPHGGYFYYAHLFDYAREFEPGDEVKAGEWIGFMGDSGYSDVEGTVGNFDVHLHVGIYVNQPDGTEMSINAYWPLKYLEDKKLTYDY